jgi:hypothetical protein
VADAAAAAAADDDEAPLSLNLRHHAAQFPDVLRLCAGARK